jgi:rhodanese-related sulfurtransferase
MWMVAGAVVVAAAAAFLATGPAGGSADRLAVLETQLHAQFGVPEVTAAELSMLLAKDTDRPVLLDVREPIEYAVSRIPGAIRIAPDASVGQIEKLPQALFQGRTVVIYCSVGYRSSRAVQNFGADIAMRGASRVVNLRGGIFRWHGEGLPVADATGPIDRVHPFDERWASYLPVANAAQYEPRKR